MTASVINEVSPVSHSLKVGVGILAAAAAGSLTVFVAVQQFTDNTPDVLPAIIEDVPTSDLSQIVDNWRTGAPAAGAPALTGEASLDSAVAHALSNNPNLTLQQEIDRAIARALAAKPVVRPGGGVR